MFMLNRLVGLSTRVQKLHPVYPHFVGCKYLHFNALGFQTRVGPGRVESRQSGIDRGF
jgi:hypothetical protein